MANFEDVSKALDGRIMDQSIVGSARYPDLLSYRGLPVVFENTIFEPELPRAHIVTTNIPASKSVVETGVQNYSGIYQLAAFYPAGTSTTDIRKMADYLDELYSINANYSHGDASVKIVEKSISQIFLNGPWCNINVSVSYESYLDEV